MAGDERPPSFLRFEDALSYTPLPPNRILVTFFLYLFLGKQSWGVGVEGVG